MKITINGQAQEMTATTVADIIKTLGYSGDYFAVAVNMNVVRRAHYATTNVQEGDHVEILTPMQGG